MKKIAMVLMMVLVTAGAVTVAAAVATVEPPAKCELCTMDRTQFNYSRMLVEYADGKKVGVCSVHCAAKDTLAKKDTKVVSFKVADYGTKELIDATTATWVVGGTKKGVMTATPKWAFAKKDDATSFIKENGGKLAIFNEVLKMAEKE